MNQLCYVYAIAKLDGYPVAPVKVGISESPKRRLAALKTGCPFPLTGVFTVRLGRRTAYDLEQTFHRYNAGFRLAGEWFDIAPASVVHMLTVLTLEKFYSCGAPPDEIERGIERSGVRGQAERVIRRLKELGASH